jgi:HK97 family phage major capsid protein
MLNINQARHDKAKKVAAAELILDTAHEASRDLTQSERTMYDSLAVEIKAISAAIDDHLSAGQGARPRRQTPTGLEMPRIGGPGRGEGYSDDEDEPSPNQAGISFPGMGAFISGKKVTASLSEGGTPQYIVPGWQVQQFITAYPSVTPFESAGATVFQTDDGHVLKVPIIAAGTDAATFAEEAGPTTDTNANIYVASLEATKYSFLTKLSEELHQDVPALESTLAAEGVRRVYMSISKAITAALVTSLNAANSLVNLGGDYLDTLLQMEAAIDPTWASPNNVWMMDRSSLSRLRNTRDLQDRPIFDPTSKTLLGYRTVLNDALQGRVIFGAWAPGVYIRKTPLVVLRLVELYSEQGKIGVRFQQRADQAFFSDAATASQAPQPLVMLNTDVGS